MKMGLPSMFKTPAPRGFDYRPRYYDEQKERKRELEQMVQEARTGQMTDERRLERMRQNMGNKWNGRRTVRQGANANQSIRFMFIAAVLSGLVWLFLNWG